jgi:hypothetical protein
MSAAGTEPSCAHHERPAWAELLVLLDGKNAIGRKSSRSSPYFVFATIPTIWNNGSGLVECAANRIGAPEIVVREHLIGDSHFWRRERVAIIEVAPCHEARTHGLEISRTGLIEIGQLSASRCGAVGTKSISTPDCGLNSWT